MSCRPTSEVTCANCGNKFLKEKREITKSNNKGTSHMCSRSCCSRAYQSQRLGDTVGFGYYVTQTRKRYTQRKGFPDDFNLDARYLKNLWDSQGGKCALSGLPMHLNSHRTPGVLKSPYYASLDRIENSRGYVKGNVQFVCLSINYMRNTFTVEQATEFIKRLRDT